MTEVFRPPSAPPPTPTPLIAYFTFSPANPDPGLTINFSGSAIGGTQPYLYKWFFGEDDQRTGQTVRYAYLVAGNYSVNLTVADSSGQTATASQAISIDTDPSPAGMCQECMKSTFLRVLGLMISCAVGVASPLVVSMIISKRNRKTTSGPAG